MRVNKALRRHELTTANAQNVENDMRQIVGHEGTVLGCTQTCYHVGMNGCIRGGKIDEKRHIKLLTLCARHIGSQVGTPQLMTIIVDLLTMVGKVEDNGVTLFKMETASSVDVRFTYYKLSKHSVRTHTHTHTHT